MGIRLVGTNVEQPEEARQATGSNLAEDEEADEATVPAPRLQAEVVPVGPEFPAMVAVC
jgi:hypothetical protein